MMYENGKYTIYTSDGSKFEMTEENFAEIMDEFLDLAERGNQAWFDKTFASNVCSSLKQLESHLEDEQEVMVWTLREAVYDTVDNIEANYYLLPVKKIEDRF